MRNSALRTSFALLAVALLAAACGDDGSSEVSSERAATDKPAAAAETLLLGASLPMSGPLASFGPLLEAGYRKAIDEINDGGGLVVGDTAHHIDLKVVDNQSDGNMAAAQARDLILGDKVVALLGAVTPPLTIPMSVVAEQTKVPFITTATPIRAWLGANEEGWKYSFALFFDELQQTDLHFQSADQIETNKRVALFTDLEEDGVVMGGLWAEKAPGFGYEIAYHAKFPVGTTDFSSQIAKAKDAGAEVVIAQITPPDAIALVRQMAAADYVPKLMVLDKGSNFGAWPKASEGLGEGVMATNWYAPGMGLPREAEMVEAFLPLAGGKNSDLGIAVFAYTIAAALLDSIEAAGSTDADAIVRAIEDLSADYPAGHVQFSDDHSLGLPAIMGQWRGSDLAFVTGADGKPGTDKVVTPVTGLR